MTDSAPAFHWRSIMLPAILPSLLFAIGEGAIIPVIPLVANDLGASLALAGLVAGVLTIGELLGNIPSGSLVQRVGERSAMIGASVLSMIGLVLCVLAPNAIVLGVGVLLIGLATAVFALARHAFLTTVVPLTHRARALSTLGGAFRLGYFVGPFLSAGIISVTGMSASAFWIHLAACLLTIGILVVIPDLGASVGGMDRTVRGVGMARTLHAHRSAFLRIGTGGMIVAALRASRQVIVPLWAVSIGVDATATAIIIGIAGGIDFALFYLSGQIMDRHGRRWVALPSLIGLGLGHLILAFTHDVPAHVIVFIVATMVLAFMNGIGSGILMTLGSDLADPANPARFLAAWRFTTGLGGAAAPLVIAGVTAAASISIAAGVLGVIGLLGAVVLGRNLPRAPR